MVEHFDRCLGCMACVTACPSGVQYDKLIEATRAQVERRYERSRAGHGCCARRSSPVPLPARLRALRGPLRAYQASGLDRLLAAAGCSSGSPRTLAAMERLAPPLRHAGTLPERDRGRAARAPDRRAC